jgi:hypothetical protein
VEEAANYKDHLKRKKKGNSLLMKQWVFKSKEKKSCFGALLKQCLLLPKKHNVGFVFVLISSLFWSTFGILFLSPTHPMNVKQHTTPLSCMRLIPTRKIKNTDGIFCWHIVKIPFVVFNVVVGNLIIGFFSSSFSLLWSISTFKSWKTSNYG